MKGILTPPAQSTPTQTDYKELYHRVHSWSYTQNMRQAAKNKDLNRLDELALELLQDYPDTAPYVAKTIATERVFRHYRARFKQLQLLI
jgi:hypothetical protein